VLAIGRAGYGSPMDERTAIGRVGFWMLLPSLLGVAAGIGLVANASGNAPGQGMFDGILLFVAVVVLVIVLTSMTFQALLIVRRPQSLTERSVPSRVAVLQFILYGVIAVWVALLITVNITLLSWLFFAAIVGLSGVLLTRVQSWLRVEAAALTSVHLSAPVRVALWGYSVLALAAVAYIVAAIVNPTLDSDGLRPAILLLAFGLPLSVVVLPVALLGALAVPGTGLSLISLALLAIVANVVVAQLLLWSPRVRVKLVNWFFRLGNGKGPATPVTGPSL